MRRLAVCCAVVLTAATVHAAEWTVRGKSFSVRDPQPGVDPSLRGITVSAREVGSPEPLVGDPAAKGATIHVVANGPSFGIMQVFVLPPGLMAGGPAGWKRIGTPATGYQYRDGAGVNGPVKSALIRKTPDGTLLLNVTIKGANGPGPQPHVTVVPPAPGTDGGIRFGLNGGDKYCVLFGGPAGGRVTNSPSHGSPNKSFKIGTTALTPLIEAGFPNTITQWYVDAVNGSDANPGTAAAPFKRITMGLSVAANEDTVVVAPGTYDAANGEVFPLVVPYGVTLVGDEATKGAQTTIVSGSTGQSIDAAVSLRNNATIAGFTITATGLGCATGVDVLGESVTVRNNSMVGTHRGACGGVGLYLEGTSVNGVASDNFISQNDQGVAIVDSAGAGTRLERNVITGNLRVGVELDVAGADLGGGSAGSTGGNVLSCNGHADLWLSENFTVAAQSNFWDHVPPTSAVSPDPTPVDIFSRKAGFDVDVTGAQVAASPCP
jgi:uncharacterized protein DUF1565